MSTDPLMKDMIQIQKVASDAAFDSMEKMQEQWEKAVETATSSIPGMAPVAKAAMDQWFGAMKNGRREWKALVDEGYNQALSFK